MVAIAAGYRYSMALKSDGTVWTWGDKYYGKLGDNTTTSRSLPGRVLGPGGSGYLAGITAIAAGRNHALALKDDGSLWGWGFNGWGQLGDGTTTSRWTPVQVLGPAGVPALGGVVAISAGNDHSLVLVAPGGNATPTPSLSPTATAARTGTATATSTRTATPTLLGTTTPTPTSTRPPSLSAAPRTVSPGGESTVSWSNVAGPTVYDWIGLYRVGAPPTVALEGWFTGGTAAGSFQVAMPQTAGSYEFRLFANNSFVLLATSNAVSVVDPTPLPTASPTATETPSPWPAAQEQRIPLRPGWNWISFAVVSGGTGVSPAHTPYFGRYDYVLGETGTYSPLPPYSGANSLQTLEAGKGYFVRMKESAELVIRGTRLAASTPISMAQGWHRLVYLPEMALDLPGALAGIAGQYDYLRGDGGTYAPPPAQQFLNTLARMEPGSGYLIRMRAAATLTYGP